MQPFTDISYEGTGPIDATLILEVRMMARGRTGKGMPRAGRAEGTEGEQPDCT